MTKPSATTVIRIVLGLIGAALLIRGGYLMLTVVKPIQIFYAVLWLGAGIVIHDAFIAPVTLLIGKVIHPGNALRFGWLAAGTVLLLSIPLIEGAKVRRNITVIPDSPWAGLAVSLGLVAAGVLIAAAIRVLRRARTSPAT